MEVMYLRLYNFNSLVGNVNILNVLKRELENKTLNNFVIFEGSPGTGKSTCAEIIALQKTCDHPVGANPCLECSHCQTNMQVLEKGDRGFNLVKLNMASTETKKNLQNIITEVFKNVPPFGDVVYIFEEFHSLNKAEQSSLLEEFRTLDRNVFIIATTTRLSEIIPEMRSRANIYSFSRLTKKESKLLLNQLCESNHTTITAKFEKLMIDYAKGIPRDLIKIFNHALQASMTYEELATFCGNIPSMRLTQMFRTMREDTLAETFLSINELLENYNVQYVADQLMEYILDVTFYLTSNQSDLFGADEKSIILKTFSIEQILKMNRALEGLNPRMCSEAQLKMHLIKLYQILKGTLATSSNSRKASKQHVEALQRNREVTKMELEKDVVEMSSSDIKKYLGK